VEPSPLRASLCIRRQENAVQAPGQAPGTTRRPSRVNTTAREDRVFLSAPLLKAPLAGPCPREGEDVHDSRLGTAHVPCFSASSDVLIAPLVLVVVPAPSSSASPLPPARPAPLGLTPPERCATGYSTACSSAARTPRPRPSDIKNRPIPSSRSLLLQTPGRGSPPNRSSLDLSGRAPIDDTQTMSGAHAFAFLPAPRSLPSLCARRPPQPHPCPGPCALADWPPRGPRCRAMFVNWPVKLTSCSC
jgi:hypothetical protein